MSSSREKSTTGGVVLTKAEVLAKLDAGTLTMDEYLPWANEVWRAQVAEAEAAAGTESPK